jgi:uncharacterized membrane protein YhiD involved in acid resistance
MFLALAIALIIMILVVYGFFSLVSKYEQRKKRRWEREEDEEALRKYNQRQAHHSELKWVNNDKDLNFEEWCEQNRSELETLFAENGADREIDFDFERDAEILFNRTNNN